MKHSLPHLIIAIFFTYGCAFQQYTVQPQRKFPTFPHEKKVSLYSSKAEVKEPFIEVMELRQIGPVGDSLVNYTKLKKTAQENGLDALLILKSEEINWTESNLGLFEFIMAVGAGEDVDFDYEYFEGTSIVASGLKFTKNINYLDQFVKRKELIELYDSSSDSTRVTINYNLSGEPSNVEGTARLYNLINRFSLDRLLEKEAGNWSFRWQNDSTLIRRNGGAERVVASFHRGLPVEIKYKNFNTYVPTSHLSAIYSYEGKLKKLFVSQAKEIIMIKSYEYDQKGRAARQFIEIPKENKKYELNYEYFRNEDLKDLVPIVDGELITKVPR